MIKQLFMCVLALSGGMLVGTAAAAFVTLLDIIPRLSQVSNTSDKIGIYEITISISMTVTSLGALLGWSIGINYKIFIVLIGFTLGAFVGLLASALAEVLNVMPVLFRRVSIEKYIIAVLIAVALGKIIGSFLSWDIINKH
ncbi:stage V sporulation protein AB [Proteiniborus ethanoligenes]|uniref:Stage V sporulation protein AB n=1 Tax=Proteiniborus ethanoligenes TaxID=415015 RepID=A0A1H3QQ53_9FIRM|nr:stage V sporulation protein AB [Proteiniborus ethanoligenes]TAH63686.1 MAG: stage V sporulation protein AC [Gottschalkiaceae bacterium]SDZ15470.1 stage V sporulation protein AB [Proteiniborus ethanoligenes]